jgi:hypothetical protein
VSKAIGLVTLGKQTVYVITSFAFLASITNYSCPQFTKLGLLPRGSSLLVTLSFLRAVLYINVWSTNGAKTGQLSSITIKGYSISLFTALWARRLKRRGSITGKGLSYSVHHRDQTGLGSNQLCISRYYVEGVGWGVQKVKRPGYEDGLNAEGKHAYSYIPFTHTSPWRCT